MKKIKTTRPGQRGESQVNTPNVVLHDIPKKKIPRRTEMLAENANHPKNVVPHDILTSNPTELDAEEILREQCRSPRHSQRRLIRVARLLQGISIYTRAAISEIISFSLVLFSLGFLQVLLRHTSCRTEKHPIAHPISIPIALSIQIRLFF